MGQSPEQENAFLRRFFDACKPQDDVTRQRYERAHKRLQALRVRCNRDLAAVYPTLDANAKFVAMCLFAQTRFRGAVELLFNEIRSTNAEIAGAASVALGRVARQTTFSRIKRRLAGSPPRREVANLVSALCRIDYLPLQSDLAIALADVAADSSETDDIRATAAEGLGNVLCKVDGRTKIYRRAVSLLIEKLHDVSPEVRCSAALAIGQLRVSAAAKTLRDMVDLDHAVCPGVGRVSDVARDALDCME
jgi:hypothetical protein